MRHLRLRADEAGGDERERGDGDLSDAFHGVTIVPTTRRTYTVGADSFFRMRPSGQVCRRRARERGAMSETYVALPAGGKAPAILLLPPVFGIEPVIRELADRYASRGFVVAVPNQFRRDAEPGVMERTAEGRARALARAERVDVEQIVDDVRDEVAALRAMPQCTGKVGVVGFCFGGRYAFLAAARLGVDAAAAFHPVRIGVSLADAPRVRVPLSLHFGADDPLTPPSEVEAVTAALRGRSDAEVFSYPGATHNFAIPTERAYDPAVAKLSEDRAFALFDRLK